MSPTSFTLSVEDNGAVISTLIWWCFVNDRYNQGNLSELVRRALFDDVGLATEFLFCLIKADFKLSEVSIFFFFLIHPSCYMVTSLCITARNQDGWKPGCMLWMLSSIIFLCLLCFCGAPGPLLWYNASSPHPRVGFNHKKRNWQCNSQLEWSWLSSKTV